MQVEVRVNSVEINELLNLIIQSEVLKPSGIALSALYLMSKTSRRICVTQNYF